MANRMVATGLALLGLLWMATSVGGQKQSDGVLEELLKLRESVGGSVLEGSTLEVSADDEDAVFRSALEKVAADQRPTLRDEPKSPLEARGSTPQEAVGLLRRYSSDLDRTANELEPLRAYAQADRLRETAHALRKLARQFDGGRRPLPAASVKPAVPQPQ